MTQSCGTVLADKEHNLHSCMENEEKITPQTCCHHSKNDVSLLQFEDCYDVMITHLDLDLSYDLELVTHYFSTIYFFALDIDPIKPTFFYNVIANNSILTIINSTVILC